MDYNVGRALGGIEKTSSNKRKHVDKTTDNPKSGSTKRQKTNDVHDFICRIINESEELRLPLPDDIDRTALKVLLRTLRNKFFDEQSSTSPLIKGKLMLPSRHIYFQTD